MNTTPLEPPDPEPGLRPPQAPRTASSPESAPVPDAPDLSSAHDDSGTPGAPDRSGQVDYARQGARTGTIVWGVLVLIACTIVLQRTFAPGTFDPVIWVTGVALGLGALLLVVAVAVILRSRR